MYKYNLGIRFQETVDRNPGRPALKFNNGDDVSYQELNSRANQFARQLLALGVSQQDVICISGVKKRETFALMIACLKLGAVYVVLDPESPSARLEKILSACRPKLLFAEPELVSALEDIRQEMNISAVCDDQKMQERVAVYEQSNLAETKKVTASNPAYIMFTSGSTGFPKGAVMTHDNVANLIDWSIETFRISPDDIHTNVNPLYFDNSVFDFYSTLFSGACLVPFPKDVVTDPKILIEMIDKLECTSWFSVPSLLIFLQTMKALKRNNMKHISRFIFGGEGYPKSKLKQLYDMYGDRAALINVYGPTECTCICSAYKLNADDFKDLQGFPPLGDMIDNFSYLILDENNRKVADNEVGELCLIGPNVGRGYYNDHTRTNTGFVQNPCNTSYSETIYKTGDLVRYNNLDDKIYIIGRKDNQIKHMGYRIELEEIETALNTLDYVSQAMTLHGSAHGISRIIAIISLKIEVSESEIRKDLQEIIPDYMIPTVYHFIDELPKNPNGKVDRKRLAETYT
jgi:D-alanine--poly(phosphoribitol) ligase subunit 1